MRSRRRARSAVAGLEAELDADRLPLAGAELEAANAAIVRLKDAVWAIATDRLRAAREVTALAAGTAPDGTTDTGGATAAAEIVRRSSDTSWPGPDAASYSFSRISFISFLMWS